MTTPRIESEDPGPDWALFREACEYAAARKHVSPAALQRNLRVGSTKARLLVYLLKSRGVIGAPVGNRHPVLITAEQLPSVLERAGA